jgi:hypothetical protein
MLKYTFIETKVAAIKLQGFNHYLENKAKAYRITVIAKLNGMCEVQAEIH